MTVHIVTDSTSDISKELAEEHGITVIPLTVSFGNESYSDGVDLTAEEFYARLQLTKTLPTTSQPPPARRRLPSAPSRRCPDWWRCSSGP